jgi:hypothetical protein
MMQKKYARLVKVHSRQFVVFLYFFATVTKEDDKKTGMEEWLWQLLRDRSEKTLIERVSRK